MDCRISKLAVSHAIELPVAVGFFCLGHQNRVKIPTDIAGNRNSHMENFFFLTDSPKLTAAKTVSNSADITLTLHFRKSYNNRRGGM